MAYESKADRNTPTCVGKTLVMGVLGDAQGKHPHVRGEDLRITVDMERQAETPPRAWGRREAKKTASRAVGNTPTCVGKTPPVILYRPLP